MHTKISSGKEHRRHRARRVSVLLVVLALLFTMLPTGLYTVADAAPAEEEPALVPAPEEALPEPEDSMTKEEETDELPAEAQPAEDKARAASDLFFLKTPRIKAELPDEGRTVRQAGHQFFEHFFVFNSLRGNLA